MTSTPTRQPEVDDEYLWTDEYLPTVRREFSPRQAAIAVLEQIQWDSVAEDFDDDTLVFHGTVAYLTSVYRLPRTRNRLVAWLTARMQTVHMCFADGHSDDDMHYFNDCWADDTDDPHQWEAWWAVLASSREFWTFAQYVAREEGNR